MRMRRLVRLEIEWCGVSQKSLNFIAQSLNELEVLNLNYCHALTDDSLLALSRHAPKLQSLSLSSSSLTQPPATRSPKGASCACSSPSSSYGASNCVRLC
jgi:hypothetical protein